MEPIIEICDVKKEYRLGAIGGTTLNAELQSFLARLRGKEDPNKKIGTREGKAGERFLALDGVSFTVAPGEAVGIIGHNGAGKSTLLKLISRVTAPSEGEIRLRGRVASMLEVGTGFHPELTGRENVYLNGAILGMTKREIDAKFDEIVDFAEMRQFIDTPVKRYSSGMYVKLAFSVAAHLDSEIMIMDEVLAVGDAKFQNKCLGKMSDEAGTGQRAILYVSHNMATIQRLCTRVIVLDHGKVVYDGDTPGGIARYMDVNRMETTTSDLAQMERNSLCRLGARMLKLWLPGRENNLYKQDSKVTFRLAWETTVDLKNCVLRCYLNYVTAIPVAFTSIPFGDVCADNHYETEFVLDLKGIVPGNYYLGFELHEIDSSGTAIWHDGIPNAIKISILENQTIPMDPPDFTSRIPWNHNAWGSIRLPVELTVHEENTCHA